VISSNNRFLVVGVSIRNEQVTTVTHGGAPLARIGTGDGSSSLRVELWSLDNPPVGSADVVVQLTGTGDVVGGAVSLAGVSASNPIADFQTNEGSVISPSVGGLLGSSTQLWLDTLAVRLTSDPDAVTASPQSSQVERWDDQSGSNNGDVLGTGSTRPSQLLLPRVSWNLSGSRPWVLAVVTLNPTPAC
jgi:hypothetical protein